MKAINFLEWYQTGATFNRTVINEVANFYSQPFKPELITELFEGWENNQGIRFHQNSNGTYFAIVFQGASDNCFYVKIYKDDDTELFKIFIEDVGTLDEFILRCNKIIELTFKPEIVKQIF